MNERNDKGQFAQGNQVGPGRPPKARELAYLACLAEKVSLEKWSEILDVAIKDALRGEDGRTREYGRRFLADYAIGKPKQHIKIVASRDAFDEFAKLDDDELNDAIASTEATIARLESGETAEGQRDA